MGLAKVMQAALDYLLRFLKILTVHILKINYIHVIGKTSIGHILYIDMHAVSNPSPNVISYNVINILVKKKTPIT